jgi:hypothetical protein
VVKVQEEFPHDRSQVGSLWSFWESFEEDELSHKLISFYE